MRVDETKVAVLAYLHERPATSLNVNELVHVLPAHRETVAPALDQLRAEGELVLDMGHYGVPRVQPDLNRRALELAKAEHARMGAAMREHMPGHENVIVTAWETMSRERRNVMVAVWRSLLDDGVVA